MVKDLVSVAGGDQCNSVPGDGTVALETAAFRSISSGFTPLPSA